jgi:hypothetical protein
MNEECADLKSGAGDGPKAKPIQSEDPLSFFSSWEWTDLSTTTRAWLGACERWWGVLPLGIPKSRLRKFEWE